MRLYFKTWISSLMDIDQGHFRSLGMGLMHWQRWPKREAKVSYTSTRIALGILENGRIDQDGNRSQTVYTDPDKLQSPVYLLI